MQRILFEHIQKTLPKDYMLVNIVAELLNISTDSAYRRIRCDKTISIQEAVLLCTHFNISLDEVLRLSDNTNSKFIYKPMNLNNKANYAIYMNALLFNMEQLYKSSNNEIILSAVDIPIFTFLPYKELTFFKLFSWMNTTYNLSSKYEDFVEQIETPDLLKCYEKIAKYYRCIPSTEIWTENTIDVFLRLLVHHYEMEHFSNEKMPLKLCEELISLINMLQDWTEKGQKDDDIPNSIFKLYISNVELENTFILMKKSESSHCLVKLFTINSLMISEEQFCQEVEKWLNALIQRSVLISGASEKERYKFFKLQRQKICFFIEKIQLNQKQTGNTYP